MELNNVEKFDNWNKWKKTMAGAVNMGEAIGISEDRINKMAFRIGNVLSAAVDPENREQRVLQELWKAGNEDERKVLAGMIVKMVQTDNVHH